MFCCKRVSIIWVSKSIDYSWFIDAVRGSLDNVSFTLNTILLFQYIPSRLLFAQHMPHDICNQPDINFIELL